MLGWVVLLVGVAQAAPEASAATPAASAPTTTSPVVVDGSTPAGPVPGAVPAAAASLPGAPAVQMISGVPWPPPPAVVSWEAGPVPADAVHLQVLAFNDFHGNLEPPATPVDRPVGGAVALASYLHAAEIRAPGRTLIVHAGDLLGASPPITRLLQNEPAMSFLNLLAVTDSCSYGHAMHFYSAATWRTDPDTCNVVGTLGNHEFDAGPEEIRRLLMGGNSSRGPYLENPWRGSRVPYVCANVIDRRTGRTLLPPYAVVVLQGHPVGVIGAVLRGTPNIIPDWAAKDLSFEDEAGSINAAARELTAQGIHTILVIIHQGVVPLPATTTITTATSPGFDWHGPLIKIVAQLDPSVAVVVSGHTHNFTNALWPDRAGKPVLVTQAYSYGLAYGDIDLALDPASGEVLAKSARILPVYGDEGPGLQPDAGAVQLVAAARAAVAPRVARVLGVAAGPITRSMTPAGESGLGDLVADAQRARLHADMALMNAGGLRSDLRAGPITWGDVLTLHPFNNRILAVSLTGEQILAVLEQQWPHDLAAIPSVLKTSGLYYEWDPAAPPGHHVVVACDAEHRALRPDASYRVAVNDFLVGGGDGFTGFKAARVLEVGPLDTEILADYLSGLRGPVAAGPEGRIVRAGSGSSPCGRP